MPIYFVVTLVLCALAQMSAKKSFRSIPMVREMMNSNLLMVKHTPNKPKSVKFSVYQVQIVFISFLMCFLLSETSKRLPSINLTELFYFPLCRSFSASPRTPSTSLMI